jgi:hypothetical protein
MFLIMLALTVTGAAQVVGTLLVLSLAITPAAAQRLPASPLVVAALSVIFAVAAADGGLLASFAASNIKASVFITSISFCHLPRRPPDRPPPPGPPPAPPRKPARPARRQGIPAPRTRADGHRDAAGRRAAGDSLTLGPRPRVLERPEPAGMKAAVRGCGPGFQG